MSTIVNTLTPDKPGIYDISEIYNPAVVNPSVTARVIPQPKSLVWENNVLNKVVSVDPNTNASTIVPAFSAGLDSTADGITDHRNTILRLFLNNNTTPIRASVDPSVRIWNGNGKTFCLYRYPGQSNQAVISSYYYSNLNQSSNYPPIVASGDSSGSYVCAPFELTSDLTDNESLGLAIFDETGAEIYYTVLTAKHSTVINDPTSNLKQIVSLTVECSQMTSDGTCYLLENQPVSSLDIYGVLTYADGTTQTVNVDGRQTFLYGISDFVPSFTGMKQEFQLRYNIAPNESVAGSNNITATNISTIFYVKTLTGQYSSPSKISVFPYFDPNSNQYLLKFFLYTTTNTVTDITPQVLVSGFQSQNYVSPQQITLTVDLSTISGSSYTTQTMKVQSEVIKLSPPSAYVRYTLTDSLSSTSTYGVDSPTQRRPVLYYDSAKNVYFVPSSIFQNQQAFLNSFFYASTPPYDSRVTTAVTTPNTFSIRDPFSMLLMSQTPVANYTNSITLAQNKNYTGGNVIVEFSFVSSTGQTLIYGMPVDVYAGTYVTSN